MFEIFKYYLGYDNYYTERTLAAIKIQRAYREHALRKKRELSAAKIQRTWLKYQRDILKLDNKRNRFSNNGFFPLFDL